MSDERIDESRFPSMVFIVGTAATQARNCTAVKVGPRQFLTAGHCVAYPATVTPAEIYLSRSAEILLHPKDGDYAAARATISDPYAVEAVYLHPNMIQWLANSEDVPYGNVEDLALVTLNEDTPEIPEAEVDVRTVRVGASIVASGYGLETPVTESRELEQSRPEFVHRKIARTPVLESSKEDSAGYFTLEAVLNEGDSGGPVFLDDGNEATVVGINSLGSPERSLAVRLSSEATIAWLSAQGIPVRGEFDGATPAAATEASCHPLINEIWNTNPFNAAAGDELVEIVNPCSEFIDLREWTLSTQGGATSYGPTDVALSSLGHAFSKIEPQGTLRIPLKGNRTFRHKGSVAIFNGLGMLVDAVGYGAGSRVYGFGKPAPELPLENPSGLRRVKISEYPDNATDFELVNSSSAEN